MRNGGLRSLRGVSRSTSLLMAHRKGDSGLYSGHSVFLIKAHYKIAT